MSLIAGDFGSRSMSCSDKVKDGKTESWYKCMGINLENLPKGKPRRKEDTIGGSDLDLIMLEKSRKDAESKKVLKQYIMFGIVAVAGYLAYKKFKK